RSSGIEKLVQFRVFDDRKAGMLLLDKHSIRGRRAAQEYPQQALHIVAEHQARLPQYVQGFPALRGAIINVCVHQQPAILGQICQRRVRQAFPQIDDRVDNRAVIRSSGGSERTVKIEPCRQDQRTGKQDGDKRELQPGREAIFGITRHSHSRFLRYTTKAVTMTAAASANHWTAYPTWRIGPASRGSQRRTRLLPGSGSANRMNGNTSRPSAAASSSSVGQFAVRGQSAAPAKGSPARIPTRGRFPAFPVIVRRVAAPSTSVADGSSAAGVFGNHPRFTRSRGSSLANSKGVTTKYPTRPSRIMLSMRNCRSARYRPEADSGWYSATTSPAISPLSMMMSF